MVSSQSDRRQRHPPARSVAPEAPTGPKRLRVISPGTASGFVAVRSFTIAGVA